MAIGTQDCGATSAAWVVWAQIGQWWDAEQRVVGGPPQRVINIALLRFYTFQQPVFLLLFLAWLLVYAAALYHILTCPAALFRGHPLPTLIPWPFFQRDEATKLRMRWPGCLVVSVVMPASPERRMERAGVTPWALDDEAPVILTGGLEDELFDGWWCCCCCYLFQYVLRSGRKSSILGNTRLRASCRGPRLGRASPNLLARGQPRLLI